MRNTFREKLARQIELEDESRALGASRYRARRPLPWRHEPSSTDEEGDLPPGHGVRSTKMKRKIQNVMTEHGVDQAFPLAMRIRTGVKAIELFCDSTGLFAIESQGHVRRR